MTPPSDERTPPLTPQLALRVAIVGTCALAMFAVIFFRLWFLQVLSGSQYVAQASTNVQRQIPIAAPRGEILDANGDILVDSIPEPSVEIAPSNMPVPVTLANIDNPPAKDMPVFKQLAGVLKMSTKPERCKINGKRPPAGPGGVYRLAAVPCMVSQSVANLPFAPVTIEQNVAKQIQYYLDEHQLQFPGVVVQTAWVRQYPRGSVAAQVLGTVGPISCDEPKSKTDCELHWKKFKGVPEGDVVGQSGLEYEYDQYLRGEDGYEAVKVNSLNQFEGYGKPKLPQAGADLKLSINLALQKVGQNSLQNSIDTNGGSGGAFVAMDPDNGKIYAMGSAPTFDPSIFTHPISKSAYSALNNPANGYPLINRAIQSVGPTGSTFKVITATAALESGDWLLNSTYDDTGQFCIDTECRRNAGGASYGTLNLVGALKVSDDVFFYNLGAQTNVDTPQGGPLQKWASKFGIGRSTGVDLPGAVNGTLPTPAWRAQRNQLEAECENATGPFKGHPKHPASQGGCGIAVTPPESWTVGDNINTAVGQGDVQVSPLQLAVVYSALANGGTIVTPHVGEDIQSSNGTVLAPVNPGPTSNLHINPLYLSAIREGLREAASEPGGTSADVMGNFPEPVYGKTGTAQYLTSSQAETDYAWYACFVPGSATTKPIVVVVWVEKGGFGDVAAAPVARQILSQWFFNKPGPFKSGVSTDL